MKHSELARKRAINNSVIPLLVHSPTTLLSSGITLLQRLAAALYQPHEVGVIWCLGSEVFFLPKVGGASSFLVVKDGASVEALAGS